MENVNKRALVVFSLGMNGDCPAADTTANIEAAVKELLNRPINYYDVVATVGGIFAHNQTRSAAQIMYEQIFDRYLEQGGVRSFKFICENESQTTRENISNLAICFALRGIHICDYDLTVVSEKWHCVGIKLLFKRICSMDCAVIESDYQIGWAKRLGRKIRLRYYKRNPHGNASIGRIVSWWRGLKAGARFNIP